MGIVVRITGYSRQLKVIDHLLETGESFAIVLQDTEVAVAFAKKATSLGAIVDW